jgi:hypothetical protein
MAEKLAAVLGVETDTLLHRSAAKAGRKKPLLPGADHCYEPTQAGSVREQ